jgi:oxygen-independent coproporphyrinogen-3 oxidase
MAGNPVLPSKINMLTEIGMLETNGNRLFATPQGRPVLNAVIRELLLG